MPNRSNPPAAAELAANYAKQRVAATKNYVSNPKSSMERPEQSAYKAYVDTARDRALRNANDREGSWFTPAINSVKRWGKDVLQGIGHVRLSDIAAQNKANAGAIARVAKDTGRFIKDSAVAAGKAAKETAQGLASTSGKEWGDYLHDSLLQFDQATTGAIKDTTELGTMLRLPGAAWLNDKANALHKHMINDYEYRNVNNKSDALRFITQNALGFAGVGGIGNGVAKLGAKALTKATRAGIRAGVRAGRPGRNVVRSIHTMGKGLTNFGNKIRVPSKLVGYTGAAIPVADKLFGFTGNSTPTALAIRETAPWLALANIRSPKAMARTLKLQQIPNLRGYGSNLVSDIKNFSQPSSEINLNIPNIPNRHNAQAPSIGRYVVSQIGADLADPGNHLTQRVLGIIPSAKGVGRKFLGYNNPRTADNNLLYTLAMDNDIDVDKYKRYLGYASTALTLGSKARTAYKIGKDIFK